ncbi:MAG: cysteine desulfurase NifS [Anaerolineales bacterium]|nr:MAG: cysteine desulfurase NifS [Anaerolineales bacterium]
MSSDCRSVYMDHAATTSVDPRVLEAMMPYFVQGYGNPSSLYRLGRAAHKAMEAARAKVAEVLGARPTEIVFTSCGTESDNLALRGAALASRGRGNHIVTTSVEHHAVGNTCAQLSREFGFVVTHLPVDSAGMVNPDDVGRAITRRTVLISVMYANNEVGTIEPIAEIGKIARERGVPFHTDAVQAAGSLSLRVNDLNVDMLSLSGHKFYAPKGVGVLYVREGTPLQPVQTGGGQERLMRAGTENVPYIVGLAAALELAYAGVWAEVKRLRALRDKLIGGILGSVPDAHLTGHPTLRLPNSASFAFWGVEGEALVLHLDLAGVAASSGSACASGEEGPSHVLEAMGLDATLARGSLRLTLGRENTVEDVDYLLSILPGIVRKLRAISPIYVPDALRQVTGGSVRGTGAAE